MNINDAQQQMTAIVDDRGKLILDEFILLVRRLIGCGLPGRSVHARARDAAYRDVAEETATALLSLGVEFNGLLLSRCIMFGRTLPSFTLFGDEVEEAVLTALGKCQQLRVFYLRVCRVPWNAVLKVVRQVIQPQQGFKLIDVCCHPLDASQVDSLSQSLLQCPGGNIELYLVNESYKVDVVNAIAHFVQASPILEALYLCKPWSKTMSQAAFQTLCQSFGASLSLRLIVFISDFRFAADANVDECAAILANAMLDSAGRCFDRFAVHALNSEFVDKVCEALKRSSPVRSFQVCFRRSTRQIRPHQMTQMALPHTITEIALTRSNRWRTLLGQVDDIPLASWPYILAEANTWTEQTSHSSLDTLHPELTSHSSLDALYPEQTSHSSLDALYFLVKGKPDLFQQQENDDDDDEEEAEERHDEPINQSTTRVSPPHGRLKQE